tara:strand:- start:18668 stop:21235 length:2568 start_codon:yes stop_codon:yes gene_type:complete
LAILFEKYIQPLVDPKLVDEAHESLMRRKKVRQHLLAKRGWDDTAITRFKLGWHHEGRRLTIPVMNMAGMVVDFRRYDALGLRKKEPKLLQWDKAQAGLFYPLWNEEDPFKENEVFILEGEPDVILARQEGLNAVTITGGCDVLGAVPYDVLTMFEGKHVVICLDNDTAGEKASQKLAKRMAAVEVASIRVLNVPRGNDFTDYIVEEGGTVEQLLKHVRTTPYSVRPITRKITDLALSETSRPEYVGKPVQTKILASGKGDTPYIVPKRVEFRCQPENGYCAVCPCADSGKSDYFIHADDPHFLSWLLTPTAKQQDLVKASIGISCRTQMSLTFLEQQTVELITLIPALQNKDLTEETVSKYVNRTGYYVGHGLETNRHFVIQAIPQPHPKSKESVLVIKDAQGAKDSFETFELAESEVEELKKVFNSSDPWKTMKRIANVLSRNHTKILGRADVHVAVDLCFHSPLAFEFDGAAIPKGSLELLLLGDTRTGKGSIAEGLVRLYDLGTVVSGENSSFMGLVGGVTKLGGHFTLQWGAFPLNHGRLVVVDEVSGLDEVLGKLSRVRSEGIAEINKAGIHSKTNANTRIIWIANPRKGREIADFGTGVEAILNLVRTQEDVARFDLVVIVSKDEVDAVDINKRAKEPIETRYTPEILRKLVLWAWSRKASQVHFTNAAVTYILNRSVELADKYSAAIPLVQGENIRFKLAKMAAAVAGRVFSSPDGVRLVVREEHAKIATRLLQWFYDKDVCGYNKFSSARQSKDKLVNIKAIDEIFEMFPESWSDVVDGLIEAREITVRDFQDWFDIERIVADKFVGTLVRCHALRKAARGGFYVKRHGFIKYLNSMQQKGLPSSR